jgi:integrase/recombinase XerD
MTTSPASGPGAVSPNRRVLRVAVAAYLGRYRGDTRSHTDSDLRVFLTWCSDQDLDPLSAARVDIERYVRWLQDVRRFQPSTVSRRLSVVIGFYRVCVIDDILPHSPADYVRRPVVPPESPTLGLGHLQFEALITTARQSSNPNDFALIAMLGLLGLRIFEACGSNIGDLGEEHGHRVLQVRGKGGKVVLVPLPPAVARAVDRAVDGRLDGPILRNTLGARMDRHAATRRLKHLAAHAGIRMPSRLHGLRNVATTMIGSADERASGFGLRAYRVRHGPAQAGQTHARGVIPAMMVRMLEVAEGVFEIRILFVHAHLVVVDDGAVLIDTGLPGRSGRIEQALGEARRAIGQVRTILLTHWHADHTGNAADLHRRTGARVVAHAKDAEVISGAEPLPLNRLQRLSARLTGTPEPVHIDEVLHQDGPFSVPDFTAIHTPGHTAGHVSYLLDRGGGVLFTGDAAAGGRRRVHRSPRAMTADPATAQSSLVRLAETRFDTAVFGHGPAVRGHAADRFKALATT